MFAFLQRAWADVLRPDILLLESLLLVNGLDRNVSSAELGGRAEANNTLSAIALNVTECVHTICSTPSPNALPDELTARACTLSIKCVLPASSTQLSPNASSSALATQLLVLPPST